MDKRGRLWEAVILENFQEFEKRGLTHRHMTEKMALFEVEAKGK